MCTLQLWDTDLNKPFNFLLDPFCILLVFVVLVYVVSCIYIIRLKYCLNQILVFFMTKLYKNKNKKRTVPTTNSCKIVKNTQRAHVGEIRRTDVYATSFRCIDGSTTSLLLHGPAY